MTDIETVQAGLTQLTAGRGVLGSLWIEYCESYGHGRGLEIAIRGGQLKVRQLRGNDPAGLVENNYGPLSANVVGGLARLLLELDIWPQPDPAGANDDRTYRLTLKYATSIVTLSESHQQFGHNHGLQRVRDYLRELYIPTTGPDLVGDEQKFDDPTVKVPRFDEEFGDRT